jgi:asparagine synthase (glutamine-hydrolysing)
LEGGTDIAFAQQVADHIQSVHTHFLISEEEALEAIKEVIFTIESFDTTTVRASTFQYLIGKKIAETTDIKVLLTGEGSDELTGGYMYFHKAPNPEAFIMESLRLLQDIHKYDGLRVDRAMAQNGLEVRIPFLDLKFTETYLSLPREWRTTTYGREKYLLRKAFDES